MIPYYQFTQIHIGPITVQVWGLLVALGIGAALLVIYRRSGRLGLDQRRMLDLAFWVIVGAFVGARVGYAFYNPQYIFADVGNFFRVWEGGLSIMGGFAGAFALGYPYMRRHKLDFVRYADVVFYALPLGLAIGRCGCGLIHDHIGKETTMPWGVRWTDGTIRHENGLYDAVNGLVLFVVMVSLYRRPRWRGFAMVVFFVWYGVVRFWLDFLRATDVPGSDVRWWGLTPAQYVSLLMVGLGLYWWWKWRKGQVVDGGGAAGARAQKKAN